jgi:hypothetical protein
LVVGIAAVNWVKEPVGFTVNWVKEPVGFTTGETEGTLILENEATGLVITWGATAGSAIVQRPVA